MDEFIQGFKIWALACLAFLAAMYLPGFIMIILDYAKKYWIAVLIVGLAIMYGWVYSIS